MVRIFTCSTTRRAQHGTESSFRNNPSHIAWGSFSTTLSNVLSRCACLHAYVPIYADKRDLCDVTVRQRVLGLKITGSSGAAAYRKGAEDNPSRVTERKWCVSNKHGKFFGSEFTLCKAVHNGPTVAAEHVARAASMSSGKATSRNEAQRMLIEESRKSAGGAMGCFVLRDSTSVPNNVVLSVLLSGNRMEHILIQANEKGFTFSQFSQEMQFRNLRQLIEHYELNPLRVGEQGQETVTLGKCVHGADIYMHDDAVAEEAGPVGPTCLMKVYVSKRDYQATDDDELTFAAGENILVAREDEDGWWLAIREATGEVGYVPNTFLGAEPVHQYRQAVPPELVGLDAEDEEEEEGGEWGDIDDDEVGEDAAAEAPHPPVSRGAPAPPPLPPPAGLKPAIVPRGGGSGNAGIPAAPPRPSAGGSAAAVPPQLIHSLNNELATGMVKLKPAAANAAAPAAAAPSDIASQVLSVKLRPTASARTNDEGAEAAAGAPAVQHDFRSTLASVSRAAAEPPNQKQAGGPAEQHDFRSALKVSVRGSGGGGGGTGAEEDADGPSDLPPPPPMDGHSFFSLGSPGSSTNVGTSIDLPPPPPDLDLDGGVDEDFVPPPPPPDNFDTHGLGLEAASFKVSAAPAPRQRKRPPTVKPKGRRLSHDVVQGLGRFKAGAKSVKVPTGRKRAPTVKPKRKKAAPPVLPKKTTAAPAPPPTVGQKPSATPPKPTVAKKPPPPTASPKPATATKPKPSIRQKPPRIKPKPSVRPRSTISPDDAASAAVSDYTNA